MSLLKQITINSHYTRAINLERDSNSLSIAASYLPTARALQTLERIYESLLEEEHPSAWSLIGPYGSGKSSFGVFCAHLLDQTNAELSEIVSGTLAKAHPRLAEQFDDLKSDSPGFCSVLITGSPESLSKRIIVALHESATKIWSSRRGKDPIIIDLLFAQSQKQEAPTTTEVLKYVADFQASIAKIGYKGLVFFIDELGKFLEYEARHFGDNEIYLLQALAEYSLKKNTIKFSLVVMLHQAFEQYAKGLGETLKNEWAKVQGRFENIPFIESSEQVLSLIGKAIQHDLSSTEEKAVKDATSQIIQPLLEDNVLPVTLNPEESLYLFESCYPLHPISALLLPILCQKVAQNERTLFSYLGSHEEHGFQESLNNVEKIGNWVYPWEIYEYFILNQPAALGSHTTSRRWAEVVSAIERLGDAPDEQVRMLKTIGLFNIVGAKGNFKATKDILKLSVQDSKLAEETLEVLSEKSVILYRKFNAEYRVWQGSDFDLEQALIEEQSKIGQFCLSNYLNTHNASFSVVARRHSISSGTLRYFIPVFSDSKSYQKLASKDDNTRIIYFLSNNIEEDKQFDKDVIPYFSAQDFTVLCGATSQLHDVVGEVMGLKAIQQNSQVLNSDPVAQHEVKDRLKAAVQLQDKLIAGFLDSPSELQWYREGNNYPLANKRVLQETLSNALDEIFYKSPKINNELINRSRPSTQANAARRKLAITMSSNENKEDLGFEKYPAEKTIYRAVLKATNLHVKDDDGKWYFQKTISTQDDTAKIGPVWNKIKAFLKSTEKQPKAIIELNAIFTRAPYGVKAGVLPIIYLAAIFAHRDELAVYENRQYSPIFSEEQIERFLKRPDEFTFQHFEIKGVNRTLFQKYSKALYNDGKERSLISVARPIAQFLGDLPEFTKNTTNQNLLAKEAQQIRDAFKLAKTPIQLLIEDIPHALGLKIQVGNSDETELDQLPVLLTNALRSLKQCHSKLQDHMQSLLAHAFNQVPEASLKDIRTIALGRCTGLAKYSIDQDGIVAFINRLITQSNTDELWLENVLTFLGKKPSAKWNDTTQDSAEYRLAEFARKINDLEKLRIHYDNPENNVDQNFEVYLLRSIKKGSPDFDKVIAVDANSHNAIKGAKEEILTSLFAIEDSHLRLSALAEIVDEILTSQNETKNTILDEGKTPKLVKNQSGESGEVA